MINYSELSHTLRGYFNEKVSLSNGKKAFVVTSLQIGENTLHSAEFFFDDSLCQFTLFYEIELHERKKFDSIATVMNNLFLKHRLGVTKFSVKSQHETRLFLVIMYHLKLPNVNVKEDVGIYGLMRDFWDDIKGYGPIWSGKVEMVDYQSRWILTEEEGGYKHLGNWIRIGDKMI